MGADSSPSTAGGVGGDVSGDVTTVLVRRIGGPSLDEAVVRARLKRMGLRLHEARGTPGAPPSVVLAPVAPASSLPTRLGRALAAVPAPHVLISDADPDPADVAAAVIAGARGWLPWDVADQGLHGALVDVAAGGVALRRADTAAVIADLQRRSSRRVNRRDGRAVQLSQREFETMALLRDGASTAEAAEALGVDSATVRGYVASAVRRLRARDRNEAVDVFTHPPL